MLLPERALLAGTQGAGRLWSLVDARGHCSELARVGQSLAAPAASWCSAHAEGADFTGALHGFLMCGLTFEVRRDRRQATRSENTKAVERGLPLGLASTELLGGAHPARRTEQSIGPLRIQTLLISAFNWASSSRSFFALARA